LDALANPIYGTLGRFQPTLSKTASLGSIANGTVFLDEAISREGTANTDGLEDLKGKVCNRYHVDDDAVL